MKRKLSYKWHIFGYFFLFAAILLSLIWVLQTVYLESFYKNIKKSELRKALEATEGALEEEDLTAVTEAWMEEYDLDITVTDGSGKVLNASEERMPMLSPQEFSYYYEEAEKAGGRAEIDVVGDARDEDNPFLNVMNEAAGELLQLPETEGSPMAPGTLQFHAYLRDQIEFFAQYGQSVVAVSLMENAAGETRMIIVKSLITPVDATIRTLRQQLFTISWITLVLALVMAFVISRYVTQPIVHMNEGAKRLAKRQYEVQFEDGSFRELSDLAHTLNVTAAELGKTETLRQELIANVSHDLRTPLTMIEAYSELMLDIPGETTPENIQVILDETRYLSGLVNDLLDISKLQAGVVELSRSRYSLTRYLQDTVARYQRMREAEGYEISFEADSDVMVNADTEKIGQVFANYMNNAIRYAGEGKRIQVRQVLKGDMVRVEVQDDGCGIAAAEIPYVWERYYRTNKDHRRASTGTGLGLSIVKRIMDLHGCFCGVESTPGKGSCFWFELKYERGN